MEKDNEKLVNVEHGHWEHYFEDGRPYIRCSVCGHVRATGKGPVAIHEKDWTCPDCRAVMDEVME